MGELALMRAVFSNNFLLLAQMFLWVGAPSDEKMFKS